MRYNYRHSDMFWPKKGTTTVSQKRFNQNEVQLPSFRHVLTKKRYNYRQSQMLWPKRAATTVSKIFFSKKR